MIVLMLALMAGADAKEGVCIAWRDPSNGKIVSSRDVADRANRMRQQVFNNDASDQSVIERARKPLECALRQPKPKD